MHISMPHTNSRLQTKEIQGLNLLSPRNFWCCPKTMSPILWSSCFIHCLSMSSLKLPVSKCTYLGLRSCSPNDDHNNCSLHGISDSKERIQLCQLKLSRMELWTPQRSWDALHNPTLLVDCQTAAVNGPWRMGPRIAASCKGLESTWYCFANGWFAKMSCCFRVK